MPLIFPSNPTINQTYSSGSSATYTWNGTYWQTSAPPTQTFVTATSASFASTASFVPRGTVANWTSAGTIQAVGITGTTSAPTLPTTTLRNDISYRQIGPKTWEVAGTLHFSSATGNALGSGDYLFTLPNSLQFDLATPLQIAFTGSVATNSGIIIGYQLANSNMSFSRGSDNYASINSSGIIPWDSTKYRISINNSTFSYRCWGSAYIGFADPAQANWRFTFQTP